jgi:NAD(P)-dependent dehydrogenase (short-subunit alcohol dehydrogenase family)
MEKVALVTGSTHNMGKAIAKTLSGDGSLVIVTSRHEDEAKDIKRTPYDCFITFYGVGSKGTI